MKADDFRNMLEEARARATPEQLQRAAASIEEVDYPTRSTIPNYIFFRCHDCARYWRWDELLPGDSPETEGIQRVCPDCKMMPGIFEIRQPDRNPTS